MVFVGWQRQGEKVFAASNSLVKVVFKRRVGVDIDWGVKT